MAKKRSKGECVYCGKVRPLTRDHVPPKNLYPEPRPSNLITVPACDPCNASFVKDDEYFRNLLVMREDTPDHPDASKVFQKILRALALPEQTGLRTALLNSIEEIELVTPAGIFLGTTPSYKPELHRLNRVVARIVKGLFYHHTGNRLLDEYDAKARMVSALTQEEQLRVVDALFASPARHIGKAEVFTYWFLVRPDDPCVSLWLLRFYQSTHFIGFTRPKGHQRVA